MEAAAAATAFAVAVAEDVEDVCFRIICIEDDDADDDNDAEESEDVG